jgi:hypothetical protein
MERSLQESLTRAYLHLSLSDANEAETRKKLLDRIIYEVLGWTHDDVTYEERVSADGKTRYADYIVKTVGVAFVIEAKRIGATFKEASKQRREKLTPSFLTDDLGASVVQAREYARSHGIDFAIATNGAVWVVFPAQRHDQVKFQDSSAVIFNSLASILRDDYQEFHDLLSREAVINGSLESTLIGRREDQLRSRRLGDLFPNAMHLQRKNPIFPLIQSGVMAAFAESIADLTPELLEKCYVSTPERMRFDTRIKMHLVRHQEPFRSQPARPMKSAESNYLRDAIRLSIGNTRPTAILVLGTVGAGKTTFLQYTRKVKAQDVFVKAPDRPYPHWIYVDLREFTSQENIAPFLLRRLRDYLQADEFFSDFNRAIEPAYKTEIAALKRGLLSPIAENQQKLNESIVDIIKKDYDAVEPYVTRLIQRATKVCPVFLVVDNIDQIEEEKLQERAFLDTMALGTRLGVNLVLALRQSTYVANKQSALFNAFDFDPIVIDSPKISAVLSRRFFLARHLLDGISGEFIAENGARVKVDNAAVFIDLVQASVLGTEIGSNIEVLASDDVRLALRMTREFLEAGYSNPGRALQVYRAKGSYVLPKHEAFRSILLGTQPTYKEALSSIWNPFDARLGRTKAQLLRLYILGALVQQASSASYQSTEGPEIAGALQKLGFGTLVTEKVLKDLVDGHFLRTAGFVAPTLACSYYPSRLGGHVVRTLLANFTFLENVMMDTFIPQDAAWEKLRQLTQSIEGSRHMLQRIKLRTERVEGFFEAMADNYKQLVEESQRRALPREYCVPLFDDVRGELKRNVSAVLQSAKVNFEKSGGNIEETALLDDVPTES